MDDDVTPEEVWKFYLYRLKIICIIGSIVLILIGVFWSILKLCYYCGFTRDNMVGS